MLYVVANVYSKIHANLQAQNLHQSPSCRIRPNRQRPAPAHDLLAGKPGTRPGRRLAGTGAQAPIGAAGTRVPVGFFDRNPRMGGESSQQKEEHWIRRALYRNLDRLHPNREAIERALAEKEKALFNLDDTIYLYDLTSTYFEGQATANPQAKRGYSRDKRPDCKQVVVGLVLDRDGFPKAHEIFDGNTQDRRSLDQMLDALEKRSEE